MNIVKNVNILKELEDVEDLAQDRHHISKLLNLDYDYFEDDRNQLKTFYKDKLSFEGHNNFYIEIVYTSNMCLLKPMMEIRIFEEGKTSKYSTLSILEKERTEFLKLFKKHSDSKFIETQKKLKEIILKNI